MPKVAQLLQKPRRATIDAGGVPIAVSYNAASISVNDYRRLVRLAEDEDQGAIEAGDDMATILSHALVSWDLEDDAGPVGTDAESLRDLSPALLDLVLTGIFEDLTPKSPTSDVPPLSTPESAASGSTTRTRPRRGSSTASSPAGSEEGAPSPT